MFCIEIPKGLNNIFSLFYYIGLWHRGERIKIFYCSYHLLFPISLMAGAITSDRKDESIFLAQIGIAAAVLCLKLFYLVWRQEQIIEMTTRIGVYSMEHREEFTSANDKLKIFTQFVITLFLVGCTGAYTAVLLPVFGKEKILFFSIGFPFDWKNDDIAFWLANAFIFTEMTLTIVIVFFSVIIWYLMINCTLRCGILGSDIRNIGVKGTTNETSKKRKISNKEKNNLFLRDLLAAIDTHQHIRDLIHQLESFFSKIFFIQIVTSGLCICASIYCFAFTVGDNLVEHFIHVSTLTYYIYDIFMIMYFGNEIELSSDRLSYCLFESDWIDKPQETKKCIILFGELLQQPYDVVVGKIYPLTLETFKRILNFAYNTFNVLKNIK